MELLAKIKKELGKWLVETRHWFHMNPEIGLEEFKTSEKIAEIMKKLGYKVNKNIGKTGLVCVLENGKGKTIAIRADMDGLPVTEENNVAYKSRNPGFMHACGHDGHITMALGAAKYFSENKNLIKGKVIFVFQPAEEPVLGAKKMVEDGLFKKFKIDRMIGLHGMPIQMISSQAKEGGIYFYPGKDAIMASSDLMDFEFVGKGGHGSEPDITVDPIPAACEFVLTSYLIRERLIPSKERVVLTFGSVQAGTLGNIIPGKALVCGTLRTVDTKVRNQIQALLKKFATATAEKWNLKLNMKVWGTPATINNGEVNELSKQSAIKVLGKSMVGDARQLMGGEDFAIFAEHVPACFAFICTGKNEVIHSNKYNFGDVALANGVAYFVQAVVDFLV